MENMGDIEQSIDDETAEDRDGGRRRARMMAAVALPSRAAIANSLASALKTLIPLERQAFNLDEKSAAPDGSTSEPVNVVLNDASIDRIKRLVE